VVRATGGEERGGGKRREGKKKVMLARVGTSVVIRG